MSIRRKPKPAEAVALSKKVTTEATEPEGHVVAVQTFVYRGYTLSPGDRLPRDHWFPRLFPYLFEREVT